MRSRFAILCPFLALLASMGGCDWMPGKPTRAQQWQPESAVTNFQELFAQNCLGCHSDGKVISPSISMNNPVYLALIPPDILRQVIANGVPKTKMPAFSEAQGGLLTQQQIDSLVQGIMGWKTGEAPPGLPPYSAPSGNAAAGQQAYQAYCDSIVATSGTAMFQNGFLTNPAFLGLSSDQYLRTLIIVGRPELGIADFRTVIAGRALSETEVSDIVAWLISQRKNEFGQPAANLETIVP